MLLLWKDTSFAKKLGGIFVDEAHCIDEWGDKFQEEYQALKKLRTYSDLKFPWSHALQQCQLQHSTLFLSTIIKCLLAPPICKKRPTVVNKHKHRYYECTLNGGADEVGTRTTPRVIFGGTEGVRYRSADLGKHTYVVYVFFLPPHPDTGLGTPPDTLDVHVYCHNSYHSTNNHITVPKVESTVVCSTAESEPRSELRGEIEVPSPNLVNRVGPPNPFTLRTFTRLVKESFKNV
ncbi:hypothetical protein K439DRAFT_1623055 [Ramaria rubella]|nr:hypothetical protein K439DRAFT_1623055 [Ramaria rubella]